MHTDSYKLGIYDFKSSQILQSTINIIILIWTSDLTGDSLQITEFQAWILTTLLILFDSKKEHSLF